MRRFGTWMREEEMICIRTVPIIIEGLGHSYNIDN
jgi:hypothetical protein